MQSGPVKEKSIDTEFGAVIVRKLALGDYAELLRSIKKLPAEFAAFFDGNDKKDLNAAKVLAELPTMIADSLPEFVDVLAAATDKDSAFLMQVDLADAMDIVDGLLELNNYSRVVATIKKIMARRQAQVPQTSESEQPKK